MEMATVGLDLVNRLGMLIRDRRRILTYLER